MDFKFQKKGYDIDEVDKFIADQKNSYTTQLAQQQERIFQLREQVQSLEQANKAYKDKSELISKALLSAVAKADEIEKLSALRYNEEIAHLKEFHNKWVSYYNKLIKKYPVNDELNDVDKFNSQMSKLLERCSNNEVDTDKDSDDINDTVATTNKSSNENQYLVNDERLKNLDPIKRIAAFFDNSSLNDLLQDKPVEKEAEPMEKPQASSENKQVFDYEEAMHPTDNLEDIMRDLGLLND